MYLHAKFGATVSLDVYWARLRWRLAKETGWPLEYIDELAVSDIEEWLSVRHGEANAGVE